VLLSFLFFSFILMSVKKIDKLASSQVFPASNRNMFTKMIGHLSGR